MGLLWYNDVSWAGSSTVEQLPLKELVVGSIPPRLTFNNPATL
jgi:hypothetical protein